MQEYIRAQQTDNAGAKTQTLLPERISTNTERSQAEPGECWLAGPGQNL